MTETTRALVAKMAFPTATETITAKHIEENINTLYSSKNITGDVDHLYGLVSITYSQGNILYDEFTNSNFLCIEPLARTLSLAGNEENVLFLYYAEHVKSAIQKAHPNSFKLYNQVPSRRTMINGLMLAQIQTREKEQAEILSNFLQEHSPEEDVTPLLEFKNRFFEWLENYGKDNLLTNSPLRNNTYNYNLIPYQDIPLETAKDVMLGYINKLNISIDYMKLRTFHEKLTEYEIIDGYEFKFESMLCCVMCGNFSNWNFLIYMSPSKISDSQKKVFVYLLSQSGAIRPHIKWADQTASYFNCDFLKCQQYFGKIVDENILLFCDEMGIPLNDKQKDTLSKLKIG